jgi:glycine betaine/proline transport system ATP-binding protein
MSEKIRVENLCKVFGPDPELAMRLLQSGLDKDAIFQQTGMVVGVNHANFHVNEGEIFVLRGLSGSGKSTLIRLLNRLVEPTHGQILLGGHDVASLSNKALVELRRKDMAMVFQSFALLPHLSVLDNTAFGLEVAGVGRQAREKRAMEVLAQVGLQDYARRLPSELSGGMQQRVGLARALAVDPTLMLMDEAFSALDPLMRKEMQDLLLHLQSEQRRTIVFVSHDLEEAFHIGDRIAIMHGGSIVQIGTPNEILRNPSNAYVKAFFKGVDVNKYLLASDIVTRNETLEIRTTADLRADFSGAVEQLKAHQKHHACVVNEAGQWVGMVSVESMLHSLEAPSVSLPAALLVGVEPVVGHISLKEVMRCLVKTNLPLPVVDAAGYYMGTISQQVLLRKMVEEENNHG